MALIGNELELGAAIREHRDKAGLTQAELAARAGVSRAFIIDIERGRRPRAELGRVLALLRALEVSITLTAADTRSMDEILDALVGDQLVEDR
ncbi:helix-turn-helix transcriptional regulator [Schaalia sp. ZJ1691]|uniref:helix-turn-helix transcriptional regulator n=1 Tax=Schaalia sp. ZJ1691 TaxID=2709404 RepID=UPI0013EDFCFE|nr:helix-turn-helix transcriptional regulator [Schaalia sp. ZJ1691]